MLKDLAVGPFVLDFTNSALRRKPIGGWKPIRLVASITILPSMPFSFLSISFFDPWIGFEKQKSQILRQHSYRELE